LVKYISLTSLYLLLCHVVDQQVRNCVFLPIQLEYTIKEKIGKGEMTNTKNILVEECRGKKPLGWLT